MRESVDNGDGTWSYALDANSDAVAPISRGPVTWVYDGQARFPHSASTSGRDRVHVVQPARVVTLEESLARFVRIDSEGRRWVVGAVDRDLLEELYGGPVPETVTLGQSDLPVGTVVRWTPLAWTHLECGDSDPDTDVHLWDGDSRILVDAPIGRQGAAVLVLRAPTQPLGVDGGECSGVLVRQNFVLTAAHCLVNDQNLPQPGGDYTVYRYDVNPPFLESRSPAAFITIDDQYTGGGAGSTNDPEDDWAIIELGGDPWTVNAETMNLSSQTNAELQDITVVHNLGAPQRAPQCDVNVTSRLFHNAESEPIASMTTRMVRLKIDMTKGHSGGPWYSCPQGTDSLCEAGEPGVVFGVAAGYNQATERALGPKVPAHRAEMLAAIGE